MPFGMFVPPENAEKCYLLFLAQNLFSNPSNLVKVSNKKYPELAENDPDDDESNTIQTIMDWVLHWIFFIEKTTSSGYNQYEQFMKCFLSYQGKL